MNHSARSSNARDDKHFAIWIGIIASFLLVLPSCCIPRLCRAKKGQPLPDTYNGSTSVENSAQIPWCEFFQDPMLTSLIHQALVGNQELQILAQEVRIASFEIQARQGEYLPFVTFGGGASVEKSSVFTREGAVEENLQPEPGISFPDPYPDFLVATNVSWEIDIWKKLRNAKNAAALRYLGTREGWNYVVTRMVAEVAENYYELLALDNQLQVLDNTIQIQEQSLEVAEARKQAARDTELAVQRFQAEVRKNQSQKLIIQQQIIEAENRINFLLGRYPQPIERSSVNYIDLQLHALSAGVPSQLLLNRADIRQAERELQAAGLDVRVARARFFPSLSLSAGVGYRAFNTKYLFISPESLIYNAAGELVGPLINKKAIKADYLTANATQLQKVYNYQRTVLNAYTEVVNRLSKVENYGRSIEIKKQQLESLRTSVDVATQLFQNARAEYMEVLLAQRDFNEARMVLIETKQQQLSAIVNAYQALGGGGIEYHLLQHCGITCMASASFDQTSSEQSLPAGSELQALPNPSMPASSPEELPPGPKLSPTDPQPLPDPNDSNGSDDESSQALPPAEPLANDWYS